MSALSPEADMLIVGSMLLSAISGHHRLDTLSIYRLRLRELTRATQDFGVRAIEPDHVVPIRHDGQAVGDLAVAASELDDDRAVCALFRGDTVQRIGVVWVRL